MKPPAPLNASPAGVWVVLGLLLALIVASGRATTVAPPPLSAIVLPQQLGRIDARDRLYHLVDATNALSLDEVRRKDADFVPVTRTLFPRRPDSVWTRVALHNPHGAEHEVLLMNPSPFVDYIDIHVVRPSGAVDSFFLGSQRLHQPGRLPHRDHVQPVALAAGETVQVYLRHHSLHAMEFNLWLFSVQSFLQHVSVDALVWGAFAGLVMATVLYNATAGILLRQTAFLYYVMYAGMLMLFTATMQGAAVMTLLQAVMPLDWSRVSPGDWENLSRVLLMVTVFTWLLFTTSYLELRRGASSLYRLLQAWMVASVLVAAAVLASVYWPIRDGVATVILYFLPLFLVTSLSVALLAAWNRYPGWQYFLAGVGSFTVLALVQDAAWFGFDLGTSQLLVTYGTPVGVLVELGCLALGLGSRFQRLRAERDDNERLLMLQSKFVSVGQMVSGVIHQLKRPVINAGNQLMKIEALLDRPVEIREAALPKALADMRRTIDFMDKAVMDMYHFYVEEKQQRGYRPAEQVELVLSMLHSAVSEKGVRIERSLQPDLELNGYPNAFANAMMILVENAVLVLGERAVAHPLVRIDMAVQAQELVICVTDNAGGIRESPPESVFNPYVSNHRREGMGIGLALARRLVEEKLKGSIAADNVREGARFTLRLPLHL